VVGRTILPKVAEENWPSFQDHTRANAHVDDFEALKEKKTFQNGRKASKQPSALAEECSELDQPDFEETPILSHLLKTCSTYSKIRRSLANVRRFIHNVREIEPEVRNYFGSGTEGR